MSKHNRSQSNTNFRDDLDDLDDLDGIDDGDHDDRVDHNSHDDESQHSIKKIELNAINNTSTILKNQDSTKDDNDEEDINIDLNAIIKNGPGKDNGVDKEVSPHSNGRAGAWNRRTMMLLKKIGEKALGYRWMHYEEFKYNETMFTRYNNIEMILMAISSGFAGALLFVQSLGVTDQVVLIVLTAIIMGTSLLSVITKIVKDNNDYPKLIFDHKYNSTKYGEINLTIQNQLALNIADRESDKEFVQNIIKNYNVLLFEAPSIRGKIMREYTEKTKDSKISKPVDVETIEIVVENNDDNNYVTTPMMSGHRIDGTQSTSRYGYEIDRWLSNF